MPRSARLAVATLLTAFLLDAPATAAPSTTPEQSFVTNGAVHKVVRTPDRTYIGGDFTYVGPRTGFGAVLDFNGSFNPTYPEVNGTVTASVADGGGGFYIAGDFTQVGDVERRGIARILLDGTVDPNFEPEFTFGSSGEIRSLSRSSNDLYVAGQFTHVNGIARANVARLDRLTGALETEWAPPTVGGVEVILHANNRVYVGGTFTQVGTTARKRLAALSQTTGALETGFVADFDSDETTKRVAALNFKNSRLYAAGAFGTVNGTARAGVAAVDGTTGALDTAFAPTGLFDFQSYTSLVSNTTHLFVGGDRDQVQSFDLATGVRDSDFAAAFEGDGFNSEATALAMNGNSTLLVGGNFTRVNGTPRQRFAALDADDGAVSNATVQSFSEPPLTITPPDGFAAQKMFVGGDFTSAGGIERRSVAALDADGNVDPAFEQNGMTDGFSSGDPAEISAMALGGDRLYVAGDIRKVDGEDRLGVFALDTATGEIVPSFDGSTSGAGGGVINDMELRDGKLYVGGQFHDIGGAPRRNLAAVDPRTGVPVAGFAPEVRHPSDFDFVEAFAFHANRMYVTGRFDTVGGQPHDWVAAINATTGAVDPAFDLDIETNQSQPMRSIATDGSRVYLGGFFTTVNGLPRGNVAAVTASRGDVVVGWNTTLPSGPEEIAVAGDRVFLAGFFTTVNGTERQGFAAVARSDGALDPWDLQGGGFDSQDRAIGDTIAVAHGRVDAGGRFTRIGVRARSGLASVSTPMPVNTGAPTVSGNPRAGQLLTCSPGTWSNGPTFGFEWLRDDARIEGADASTYAVTAADAGKRIACLVTASNGDGSGEAASAATTIERPPAPPAPPRKPPPPAGGTKPGGSPPPAGDPGLPQETPAAARIARSAARLKRGVITVRLSCPAGGGGCSGRLVLSTGRKRIGSARFRIAAGRSATVKVKVSRKLRARVAKLKKVRATAGPARATLRLRR
jgi:hypothetical protein